MYFQYCICCCYFKIVYIYFFIKFRLTFGVRKQRIKQYFLLIKRLKSSNHTCVDMYACMYVCELKALKNLSEINF